jgi:hypothetical protein
MSIDEVEVSLFTVSDRCSIITRGAGFRGVGSHAAPSRILDDIQEQ